MSDLFDIPETTKPTRTEKCGTCENIQRWACNSKFFHYCGIRKSNRTGNGLLKVLCKTVACAMYKQETK